MTTTPTPPPLPTTLVGLYAALRDTQDATTRDRLLDAILDHPDHDPRPRSRAR